MNPLSFLQDMAGYAQVQNGPEPRVRLGTIDPTFVAASFITGTLPKVTFDGESTLSGKTYPVLAPYWPHPSDRVVMIPLLVGQTFKYVIIGTLDDVANVYMGGDLTVGGDLDVTGNLTADSLTGDIAASSITSGTLAVARGGTNIGSYTTGNYIRASSSSVLAQRTPTQVRADIAAGGQPTSVQSSTTVPVTATSYTSSGTGLVFTAVGTEVAILITDFMAIDSSTASARSLSASTQVRTGGTIGSGTITDDNSDAQRAVLISDQVLAMRATVAWTRPITGLTAGNTYNVRIYHKINNGTSFTAESSQRSITVMT